MKLLLFYQADTYLPNPINQKLAFFEMVSQKDIWSLSLALGTELLKPL